MKKNFVRVVALVLAGLIAFGAVSVIFTVIF